MREFKIILDNNATIAGAELEHLGTFANVNEGCVLAADDNIARLELRDDRIVQIHLAQYTDAKEAIEEHKDDPIFDFAEDLIMFTVYDGFSGKEIEKFDGDFVDALIYIYNNGEEHERV